MKKVRITINDFSQQESVREITMEVSSCQEISKKSKIDYLYKKPADNSPVLKYFEIGMNGKTKIMATVGKVELIESPVQENIIQTWGTV